MVSCDALVRSGVGCLPGLTTVPQKLEPDMSQSDQRGLRRESGQR